MTITREASQEIAIAASPEAVYNFVTTIRNWVHTHPAAHSVRGVTERSARCGDSWTETVYLSADQPAVDLTWKVERSVCPQSWFIRLVGGDWSDVECTIHYEFRADGDTTTFRRTTEMTASEQFLAKFVESLSASYERNPNDQYLTNVKNAVEQRVAAGRT